MKLWKIALLAAVILLPKLGTPAVDVGRLEPVQAVLLTGTEHSVELRTDTDAVGEGKTLAEAVAALRSGASREVFLDTADFLLLSGEIPSNEALLEAFRPACAVCRTDSDTDPEAAAAYLRQHPPTRTLGELRAGLPEVEKLTITERGGVLCRIPS